MTKYKLTPSIMTCDVLDMRNEILNLKEAGIEWLHFDLMDGKFVPNLGLCTDNLRGIKRDFPELTIDAHCMVNNIKNVYEQIKDADYITAHLNSDQGSIKEFISFIKEKGHKVGLGFDLNNSIIDIEPFIKDIDLITLMSIKPGFAGQKFNPQTWENIKLLVDLVKEKNPNILLQIDGGVRWENIKKIIDSGLDLIVIGSLIFSESDYKRVVEKIETL